MNRTFGIELELTPHKIEDPCYEKDARTLTAITKVPVKNFFTGANEDKKEYSRWTIKDEHTGCEITSPPMTSYLKLHQIVRAFQPRMKDRTTQECGLHVHVGVGKELYDSPQALLPLLYRYYHNQTYFYDMNPKYPDRVSYCKHWYDDHYFHIRRLADRSGWHNSSLTSHFNGLSLGRLDDIGTVEFRMAPATTVAKDIAYWTAWCQHFVEATMKKGPKAKFNKTESFDKLAASIGLPKHIIQWGKARIEKYAKKKYEIMAA